LDYFIFSGPKGKRYNDDDDDDDDCDCTAIQMGRPSKTRNGNDTSSSGTDANGLSFSSPVNLTFQPSGTAAPASDGPPASRDAAAEQQPDSTADRCTLSTLSRKRPSSSVNVLRQLQSQSVSIGGGKQIPSWADGGENVAVLERRVAAVDRARWAADVAADLRVKRARYAGVQYPSRTALPAGLTGCWADEDLEPSAAATAVYDTAVGSPSVTSSGRRDSLDDQDDDDEDEGSLMVAEPCFRDRDCATSPLATSVGVRRHRRRSLVDTLDCRKPPGTT